jgi:tetratricopeptide (TPR) repeat protein
MSHLDEDVLGRYVIEPARISPADRAHLDGCGKCQAALQDLREFDDLLRDPVAWIGISEGTASPVRDELRAFAVRIADEDDEALRLLDEFKEPSAAARFVWLNVADKPEYQTGGVARLLCQWANRMCARDALYALKLAEAATIISQSLPDTSYPRNTIHELRGEALKEQANALLSLGRLGEAAGAIDAAETEYRELSQESSGLASLKYLRGAIHCEQEQLDSAEQAAHEAAELSRRSGATEVYVNARHLLGYVLFDRNQYAEAAEVYEDVLRYGEAQRSDAWTARASLAVGGCHLELGHAATADRYLHRALQMFSRLGYGPDIARTQWAIGRLIFLQGNTSEAVYRLHRSMKALSEYGNMTDAALVAIDLAELLSATGRQREIPKVLANVVQTFIDAGKLTSALTALAFLKSAADQNVLSAELVSYVRRFVQRCDRRPELVFVPPPVEPL